MLVKRLRRRTDCLPAFGSYMRYISSCSDTRHTESAPVDVCRFVTVRSSSGVPNRVLKRVGTLKLLPLLRLQSGRPYFFVLEKGKQK
jgi:hypothetical protein